MISYGLVILTGAALLVFFQIKHFLADYVWQNDYHLGKFNETGWVAPLASHCGYHFILTVTITLVFIPFHMALVLGVLDFVIHFIVDRLKVIVGRYNNYTHQDRGFWIALGADQMMHHITHYVIIGLTLMIMCEVI